MKRTMLIVEDSPIDLKVLKHALTNAHCDLSLLHYDTADSALEYLSSIIKSNSAAVTLPALVTLDLNLPGMHGLDFLRSVKADADLAGLPIIIISTSDNPSDVHNAYQNGAAAYMKKKLSYNEFQEDVNNMVKFWLQTVLLDS